jgi:predicted nucleotide-binding protein (sugar kinase/HSP70/actin superfamily)
MIELRTTKEEEGEEITECDIVIAITNLENLKQKIPDLTDIEIQLIDITLYLLRAGLEQKCWFKEIKKEKLKKQEVKKQNNGSVRST